MLAATVTANRCGIVNVEFECEKVGDNKYSSKKAEADFSEKVNARCLAFGQGKWMNKGTFADKTCVRAGDDHFRRYRNAVLRSLLEL
ncbi:hypothetical protein PtrV1_10022 [Pyrenophora tritici-repentis]|nr:hypothetical protein PtrV1_10022 [Pyrenophora tritici-repentis]